LSDILSKKTIWAHGAVGLPLAVIGYPLSIWIPAHYSGGLGISLAAVGTILMLARLTDVITDPLVGEISDRFRTRIGRRKPWLLAGMPVMMIGVYNLFIPPEGVGLLYFLMWLTIFFLGATMIALPHRAWGAELSPDYHQRSRVTAAREVYVLLGLMLAAAVPMIIEIRADGGSGVAEVFTTLWNDAIGAFSGDFRDKQVVDRATLTGPVLAGLAWTVVIVLPICIGIAVFMVKEPKAIANEPRPSLKDGLKLVMKNGPMLRVLLIVLLVHFGESFRNAVSLFFIRDIVGVPMWLGRKIGKHRAFMGTLITVATVSGANLFLGYGDYLAFFLLFIIKGFCFGGLQFLPFAMLADVVDVDAARSGGKRAGTYFAFLGFTEKMAIAFGTGVSLNVVGLLGFNPSGGVAASTEIGVLSLRLVYCLGPILFYGLALKLIWSYPLTPARHARLRESLERRAIRLGANSPSP
jgi:Na+/melibiose symporter-like transporter